MKVGDWARYKERKTYLTNKILVGEILEIMDTGVIVSEYGYVNRENDIIKTSDTLVDLLEVGDIVHIKDDFDKDLIIIKSQPQLEGFKRILNNDDNDNLTITAIELHENRVKQNV